MKLSITREARTFTVNDVVLKDHGKIFLEPDEMVSFVTSSGKEYDFTAKDWGYYVTSSINGRLKKEGFRTALVENQVGRVFVIAVESEKLSAFEKYRREEKQKILIWLDEHPEGISTSVFKLFEGKKEL